MTDKEIILQLSEVIAEQKKQISSLESTKDYLRGLNDESVNQINKLNKEIEGLNKILDIGSKQIDKLLIEVEELKTQPIKEA